MFYSIFSRYKYKNIAGQHKPLNMKVFMASKIVYLGLFSCLENLEVAFKGCKKHFAVKKK